MAGSGVMILRWAGRLMCLAGLAAWVLWLAWRVTAGPVTVVGLAVLALEVGAFAVACVLTAALWSAPVRSVRSGGATSYAALPDVVATLLGLDTGTSPAPHGPDDTGEVARARRGLRLLDPRAGRPRLAGTAWALIAIEGIRRMLFVAVLVAVLLSGRFPFDVPTWTVFAPLVVSQLLLATGHWSMSGGVMPPGSRLRWSMASVGAGLGDGISRSGLPIRWTATLATMVALNLAVSLRGLSDRWTHGLGAMPHDERVLAMVVAWWLVLVGFAALRVLPQPSLGYYGATRRLEETSTRRMALGTTIAVALVGFVAGVLPAGMPA